MAVTDIISALADENRRQILMLLRERSMNSGDLAQALGISPQALSYHLNKLKRVDLIRERREKNFRIYEINLSVLDEALMWISSLKGEKKND